jgi:dolichyl-phosphate beta-glucosyltransferase
MLRRSIVVPLYQESTRIGGTVQALADSPLCEPGTEFLFVDDGSDDGTVAVLEQALAGVPLQATVLRLSNNQGKGAAVRSGVLAARGATVAFVDADLSSPPSAIEQVLAAVEQQGAQVALASRAHPRSDITARQPLPRETAGKTFNRLIRLLGLTTLPDTQCGLKAFDRDTALALFEPLRTRRFAFDVELLVRAEQQGRRVQVVPTEWAHVPESRVAPLRDGLRMAWDALRVAAAARRSL